MNELVSIIIPVYNVEKYIEKTVESVLNQDYKNIEVILVNDGSQDKSKDIIEKFSKIDSRIRIINKENGGVSSARNEGIRSAAGDYITFIDGDDWVEPNYVAYFLNLIKKYDANIAMNKNNFSDFNKRTTEKTYSVSAEKAIEWIYLGDIFVAVWNKMYRTEFIKGNNILFDESIWYGEGMLFNIDCLQFVDSVAIGEKNVYHQVSNPNSAMRKFNVKSNLCGIRSLEVQKNHWVKKNNKIDAAWRYHRRAFNLSIISGLIGCNMENDYPDLYQECKENLRKNLKDSLLVRIPAKMKLVYLAWFICPNIMVYRKKGKSKIHNSN